MVWERMHSGRLKVFPSLTKYLDERRLYRRDERDQIVKERDNLQDAARCRDGIAHYDHKNAGIFTIPSLVPRRIDGLDQVA